MSERPQVAYVVVEVDYHEERDEPLHIVSVSNLFESLEDAENECEERKNAYQRVCEEKDITPYDAKKFDVHEIHIWDSERFDKMEEDRHETMMSAVNAVGRCSKTKFRLINAKSNQLGRAVGVLVASTSRLVSFSGCYSSLYETTLQRLDKI